MVRRRAVSQSRDDVYRSRRDYQTLHGRRPLRIVASGSPLQTLIFIGRVDEGDVPIVGLGAYLKPTQACRISAHMILNDKEVASIVSRSLGSEWNRLGLAADFAGSATYEVLIRFAQDPGDVLIWGLDGGRLFLPDIIIESDPSAETLLPTHLAPETFYLPQESATSLKIGSNQAITFHDTNEVIHVKKCSYCQRYLPVDPDRLGALAFHKHNAKLTKHQNECRACKKWRINDDFNPKRTPDQLHESSVITRERKIFLREPEILYEIKAKI